VPKSWWPRFHFITRRHQPGPAGEYLVPQNTVEEQIDRTVFELQRNTHYFL
jgi:hypothetical protein